MTAKQQAFVKEYLVDLNATQAAIRAGYSGKTAQEQASRLLSHVMVQQAIQIEMDARASRTGITADKVLQELAAIGFAKIGDYLKYDTGGRVRFKSSSEVDTRVISEMTEKRGPQGVTVAFKLHDKVAALTKLGQHLGLFKEKVELTGKDGGPVQVEQKILPRDQVLQLAAEMGLLPGGGKKDGEQG